MKKYAFYALMLFIPVGFSACSGDDKKETTEQGKQNEEEISEEEFEKEMEELDEDVESLESVKGGPGK